MVRQEVGRRRSSWMNGLSLNIIESYLVKTYKASTLTHIEAMTCMHGADQCQVILQTPDQYNGIYRLAKQCAPGLSSKSLSGAERLILGVRRPNKTPRFANAFQKKPQLLISWRLVCFAQTSNWSFGHGIRLDLHVKYRFSGMDCIWKS
jgi:hypothetical protein